MTAMTRTRNFYSTALFLTAVIFIPLCASQEEAQQTASSDDANTIGGLAIPDGVKVVPDIFYREGDTDRWQLDLAMPEAESAKPRPAIVFVHGGGWRNGDKRRANFLGPALEFASKGYVCVSTNYRLVQHAPFPACVEDVKCAVRWLRAHAKEYNIDPERIGAYGNSAGAHLVAMLGLCPPEAGLEGDGPWQAYSSMVQAVVCSATPASFMMPMNDRAQQSRQNDSRKAAGDDTPRRRSRMPEELRKKVSPLTYVTAEAPAFLIIHDTADKTVSIRQGDALNKALKYAGAKDITYMRFEEGYGHGVFRKGIAKTGPAMEAFFERTLKGHQK